MPAPYRLILFDFDGTLVDTIADIAFYANEALARRGLPRADIGLVKEAVGWGVHELFKILAPSLAAHPGVLEEAVAEFKRSYRAEPVRETRPFPGVVECLNGPLKNVRKAIVTNKPQDITLLILEKLRMGAYFEGVIGLEGGFAPKPDPSAVRHLMTRAAVGADKTVYVGDSSVDALTSRAAGIDFAWVKYGYQDIGEFRPAYRFSGASEWKALVR